MYTTFSWTTSKALLTPSMLLLKTLLIGSSVFRRSRQLCQCCRERRDTDSEMVLSSFVLDRMRIPTIAERLQELLGRDWEELARNIPLNPMDGW